MTVWVLGEYIILLYLDGAIENEEVEIKIIKSV